MRLKGKTMNNLCECGCGKEVHPSKMGTGRFIHGHNSRGSTHPMWKGGRIVNKDGYILIHKPDHPRANSLGYVGEHVLVLETKMGRFLIRGETPHHIDGNRSNNHPDNLILFDKDKDHKIFHQRQIALKECGHSHWRKCKYCHKWDDIKNLTINWGAYHRLCFNEYMRKVKQKKRLEGKIDPKRV